MSNLNLLVDEFRDSAKIRAMVDHLNRMSESLNAPMYVMEVCGGHTHAIMRHGLPQLLSDKIQFVHGPGCPVCIMPKERIDHAISLAMKPNTILVTLGDMVRVPGSKLSLAQCRANGGRVEAVYDPLDALTIARQNPEKSVVYFAIGFETTTPMTAIVLRHAVEQNISNLSFHVNHVLVPLL